MIFRFDLATPSTLDVTIWNDRKVYKASPLTVEYVLRCMTWQWLQTEKGRQID